MAETKSIPVGKVIITGDNPRQEFGVESLKRLGNSIETHGLLQPIIVRPKEGYYELVVGERRLRAAQLKGMKEIEAKIEDLDDATCTELRLIENVHREDLTDAEKGDAIYALMERHPKRYPTIAEVARSINTPYGTVIKWTRQSRKLSNHIKKLVAKDLITDKHAYMLLKYDHSTQDKLADAVVRNDIPTTLLTQFSELYDADPTAELDEIARKVKGVKKVEVELAELPKEARKEVEKIAKEKEKKTEKARKEALEKARKARNAKKKRRAPKEEVEAAKKIAAEEFSEIEEEERARKALERKKKKIKGIKRTEEKAVHSKLIELGLPYNIESELAKDVNDIERQLLVGKAIKEHSFDERESRALIGLATKNPMADVGALVKAVMEESARRKGMAFMVLEIGPSLMETLNIEAERRDMPVKDTTRLLLVERLEEIGYSEVRIL